MHILLSRYHLAMPMVQSLKEKRGIVRRITSTIRNRYNVSVAEIGSHDDWQSSDIGVVTLANERTCVEKIERSILDELDMDPDAQVEERAFEWL